MKYYTIFFQELELANILEALGYDVNENKEEFSCEINLDHLNEYEDLIKYFIENNKMDYFEYLGMYLGDLETQTPNVCSQAKVH